MYGEWLDTTAQKLVIVENTVMGQSKHLSSGIPQKRMVVSVPAGFSLGGHTGVTHDDSAILRNAETQFVGLQRTFVDTQVVMGAVSDSGGIGAPLLTFCCQYRENMGLFPGTEPSVTVNHPK